NMRMLIFLLLCGTSSPEKHSLTVLVTASSGLPHFPDFVTTTQVDKLPTSYCDSNKNIRANPKYGQKLINIESQIADWYIEQCFEIMSDYLKVKMGILTDLNQSEAVHILQVIIGCKWEEKTKETTSFLQFGYNGADFIKFDPKKLTWIPQTPQAASIKPKWEADESTYHLKRNKDFLNQICPDWLKKYMANNEDLTSVVLLQKTPSSLVNCFATGFYPNAARMFWMRDGMEIQNDKEPSEILPNHDNTYQMSVYLNVSSIASEDWKRYDCVFRLGNKTKLTRLKKEITEDEPPSSSSKFPADLAIGLVVGLILLCFCITGLFLWKNSLNGTHLNIFYILTINFFTYFTTKEDIKYE
uniref:Ig-like domain-containing protein n=1 Tax=Xiphophorus maculatus TaxID=8083 RepID=A0A3B5PWZ8_XIPMA